MYLIFILISKYGEFQYSLNTSPNRHLLARIRKPKSVTFNGHNLQLEFSLQRENIWSGGVSHVRCSSPSPQTSSLTVLPKCKVHSADWRRTPVHPSPRALLWAQATVTSLLPCGDARRPRKLSQRGSGVLFSSTPAPPLATFLCKVVPHT